jgi:hypothetical protein
VWPPIEHFERHLEEVCPKHVYPIKHNLKDYDMMNNFMTLGSLTLGMELMEDSGRSSSMPFLGQDAVTAVNDGHPHQGGAACLA